MFSLDTETTGVDFRHGAQPFFVTACGDEGDQIWWEWDVDPLTRRVILPSGDREEILQFVHQAGSNGPATGTDKQSVQAGLVLQNSKFDVTALLEGLGLDLQWPWDLTHDTLIAGHVLASGLPHDLTTMALHYLGWDIEPYEKALEEAVQKGRRWCRGHLKEWAIAKKDLVIDGRAVMPSAREKTWKFDTWLPRTLVQYLKREDQSRYDKEYGDDHPYWTMLRDYSNADSAATVGVWAAQYQELHRRGLWEIYEARRKVMGIAYKMERRGVTVSEDRLAALEAEYREESETAGRVCTNIATEYEVPCKSCECSGSVAAVGRRRLKCPDCGGLGRHPYELRMPRGGSNASLREFAWGVMRLEEIAAAKSKTGNASLDKNILGYYINTLPDRCLERTFVQNLANKRQRDTAVTYMIGYRRFWLPYKPAGHGTCSGVDGVCVPGWYVLHPSLNPTGTATLRWSSSNPNEQNISKKEGFNLRHAFGPAPGREWWSLDAKNIELRIPAYESGEEDFIALFERPDDPPYFGSNHLLIAHLLHPEEFDRCWSCARCSKEVWVPAAGEFKKEKFCQCQRQSKLVDGRVFKKRYASTLYQRTKNGDFAVQYGAVDKEDGTGTADRTYGIPGAQARIKGKFIKQEALNQHWIQFAERHGYVETLPDKTVNPRRGYPVMCTRTEWGRIKPTVPLNYHVQSTAMWWMQQAMARCDEQLEEWRDKEGLDAWMVMQVHDELVFDFPKSVRVHKAKDGRQATSYGNLPRLKVIKRLMEQGGDDIGVPTPVSCSYHTESWAEGVDLL